MGYAKGACGAMIAVVVVVACGLWGCQGMGTPANVRVMGREVLRVQAAGDQVYTWDAAGKTWKLKGPDATFSGPIHGRHFAGPTWAAEDGSSVKGRKLSEAASPDADAVPWLLLEAVDHGGNGVLSGVTYIQRVNTAGGRMPTMPGGKDGDEVRVHYTATYVFYGAGAATRPAGG